ncbi:MAG: DedA family protein [Candidatus Kapabacteria bacterium]|nr:DedA family protein [Ignavibacteriota bacterium]MCW5883958.1 DedA family protein [Candidatus Kapabacteria bacterium]
MLETIIDFLSQVPWYWVLIIAFITTFTENIFPPSPGDSVLVFMGTLIGIKSGSFVEILLVATLGSTLGFAVMYYLGLKFDTLVMDENRFKFISRDAIKKVESWFAKYGYGLIIANRFLSGTRAVISFFAGMSKLNFTITIALSIVSSLVWNSILLGLGNAFGDNWEAIDKYLSLYGKIIFPVAIIIVVVFVAYQIFKNKSNNKNNETDNTQD